MSKMLSGTCAWRTLSRHSAAWAVRTVHTSSRPYSYTRFTNERRLAIVLATSATLGFALWRGSTSGHAVALEADEESSSGPRKKTKQMSRANSVSSEPPPVTETGNEIIAVKAEEASATSTSDDQPAPEGAADEEDGGKGGAYDPVTGEINWDCPCLGGMAHGPCGQEFREAFSCFVYSEQEPKGIECVEKFKAMQDCFREHPDVYAEEIMDDDDEEILDAPSTEIVPEKDSQVEPPTSEVNPSKESTEKIDSPSQPISEVESPESGLLKSTEKTPRTKRSSEPTSSP